MLYQLTPQVIFKGHLYHLGLIFMTKMAELDIDTHRVGLSTYDEVLM